MPSATPPAGGPSRSDAQRNRERILDIALVELEADPNVALRTIAKNAGVGQGTLYRHFPDREALLWAVHHREVERLADAAAELLEHLPPLPALREWLRRLGAFAVAYSDLGHAMHHTIVPADGPISPGHAFCADHMSLLVEANRRAGTIHPDVTGDDLLLALAGIWHVNDPDPVVRKARTERLINIVVAGATVGAAAQPDHAVRIAAQAGT